MNETANRLHEALARADMLPTELARLIGVSDASISQQLKGKHGISKKTAEKMAKALNVSPLWLMGYDVGMSPERDGLPIIGKICAGNGIPAEQTDGTFHITTETQADFCLYVQGDSMTDADIYDGDVAFIRKHQEFKNGGIYAVLIIGEDTASIKRVFEQGTSLILSPCNPRYAPEIKRKVDAVIMGEVVGVYHKIKSETADAIQSR